MISFARQDLIFRPIETRLYLFADERSEGENKYSILLTVHNLYFEQKIKNK